MLNNGQVNSEANFRRTGFLTYFQQISKSIDIIIFYTFYYGLKGSLIDQVKPNRSIWIDKFICHNEKTIISEYDFNAFKERGK